MKMYSELADWWPLLSAPHEYAEEASVYQEVILKATNNSAKSLLELGSGGGNNASYLKKRFDMTLVDLSPEMLAVSKRLNPELEHHQGDMRTLRLKRQFDAVFVHDAVMYMTTESDLRAAIQTAQIHCKPGGAAIFAPDCVKETFQPQSGHGGYDDERGQGLRYLEWDAPLNPNGVTFYTDFAILLRKADGTVRLVHDRHKNGLFPRATWLRLLKESGFNAKIHSAQLREASHVYEIFVGTRPVF